MKMMKIGSQTFDTEKHTYVCGILNVTPDSFSDGGYFSSEMKALAHVEEMIEQGASIIDIGGESTRPGYTYVEEDREIERIIPVIRAIKKRFSIPISVDTYKAKVAREALEAGADLINDIWGLQYDKGEMAEVISAYKVPCCLMHNRQEPDYLHFLSDVVIDLKKSLEIAHKAGIADEKIILDPGIGFAKTVEQNLQLMNHLEVITGLGYPVLLGTSRKSMIGRTLELPVDEREEGTLVTTVMACEKHITFIRVHDVIKNMRAVKMAEAIINS